MKLVPQAILSKNEDERVAQLGVAFRKFIGDYLSMVVVGVKFTPRVARELALAFTEFAASVLIATSDAAANEPDDQTAARCERAAKSAVELIEREVVS